MLARSSLGARLDGAHAACRASRKRGSARGTLFALHVRNTQAATRDDLTEKFMSSGSSGLSVDAVIRDHHASVVRFLRRRGASYEDARDLAQEAYVRLLKYEGSADIESPSAMLFRIAGNVATDHLRAAAQNRGPRHVDIEACDDEVASELPSAERELSAEQDVSAIDKAIAGLSPRCRRVFLLSRVEELTYAEIAERCGVSVKAVEKHVSRALRACSESMDA